MKLSDERINFLSHELLRLADSNSGIRVIDEVKALKGIKQAFYDYLEWESKIDSKVRDKIRSLRRNVSEGSREWDVLYRQYFDEELARLGLR